MDSYYKGGESRRSGEKLVERWKPKKEEEWRRRERRAELVREDDERRARKREKQMRKLEERRQRGELSEASEERHRRKRQKRAAKLAKQGRRVNENDIEGLNEIGILRSGAQLAGLDLAFANYHASFAAAGPSLQSLSDFLLGFFNPPIPEMTTTEAPPPTDYSWIWITALCLVGAVALGVGIYFLRKWCIKQEAKRRWEMRFELNRGETNRKIDLRMMYAVKTWRTGIEGFVMKISVDPSCLAKLTKWAFAMGSGGPDPKRKTIDCPEKNRDDGVPLYEENSTVSILNMPKEKFWYHSSEIASESL